MPPASLRTKLPGTSVIVHMNPSETAKDGHAPARSSLTISAEASDNVGVVKAIFRLDGTDLKPEDLTAPYSITLNMSKIPEGTHTLTAVAFDAAGNFTTSSPVSIVVNKR